MIFEQVVHRDLGCAGYVVGCQEAGEAVVVDPPLDLRVVDEICRREGAMLVGVLETHNHADHVSGHGVLAGRGAWIAVHRAAEVEFEARLLDDGDTVEVGAIRLTAVHTPGHRPEHTCFLVADTTRSDDPWLLLSGDSLFVGDVARPDLAIGAKDGATALYDSLHERLLALEDGVEVFPGHVAGSLCGKGMSSKASTTLGFERRHNAMLAEMSVKDFVARATGSLAPKPPNVDRIVGINRGPLVYQAPRLRSTDRVPIRAQVLDVRDGQAFAQGHVPGSLNVPVSGTGFGTRAGFVLDPDRPVVLVSDRDDRAVEAQRRLAAVGFGDVRELAMGPGQRALARLEPITMEEAVAGVGELQLLDVREPDEGEPIEGAVQIPYRLLLDADLSALDPERPVAVFCQTGGARTPLGASILAARGFTSVRPVLGAGAGSLRAHV